MNFKIIGKWRRINQENIRRQLRSFVSFTVLTFLFPIVYAGVIFYQKKIGVKLKFGSIVVDSIGGLHVIDGFLRRTQNDTNYTYVFLVRKKNVVNHFYYELLCRKVIVLEVKHWLHPLESLLIFKNRFSCVEEIRFLNQDESDKYRPVEWFNDFDRAEGSKLLAKLGIDKPEKWYVTVFARDTQYDSMMNKKNDRDYHLKYHNHRNSDISTYIDAIKFIIDKGGYVIRIGRHASVPIKYSHPRLIDYSFSKYMSDFADIYLVCHGKFVLGCESGIVELANLVDLPMALVNNGSYVAGAGRKNAIYIPKLIIYNDKNKIMSLTEFSSRFNNKTNAITYYEDLIESGYQFVDNTNQDILEVMEYMYSRFVEGKVTSFDNINGATNKIWAHFAEKHPELLD